MSNEEKEPANVPFFVHENMMMHFNTVNRRMLIIVLTVCTVLILTIGTLVVNYTIRTESWLKTLQDITANYAEVINGVHQQPN